VTTDLCAAIDEIVELDHERVRARSVYP